MGKKGFKVTLNVVWLLIAADLLEFSHCHNHLWGLQRLVGKKEKISSERHQLVCWRQRSEKSDSDWLETMERQHSKLSHQI